MKIYLAGPIFTYGDLLRNTEWAAKIREAFPDVDLYSPVENTDINGVEGKVIDNVTAGSYTVTAIFKGNNTHNPANVTETFNATKQYIE